MEVVPKTTVYARAPPSAAAATGSGGGEWSADERVARPASLCAQATGEAVTSQDEAMIRILSRLSVEHNWWSFTAST